MHPFQFTSDASGEPAIAAAFSYVDKDIVTNIEYEIPFGPAAAAGRRGDNGAVVVDALTLQVTVRFRFRQQVCRVDGTAAAGQASESFRPVCS